jgi:hypothetical protein
MHHAVPGGDESFTNITIFLNGDRQQKHPAERMISSRNTIVIAISFSSLTRWQKRYLFLRYDYEDVFRALMRGVEDAVTQTRRNWKMSSDMANYREGLPKLENLNLRVNFFELHFSQMVFADDKQEHNWS